MGWFRRSRPGRVEIYKVTLTYEALVMARNEIHAVNRVRELRNDVWDMTRKYIGQFAINEDLVKAKKL